MRKDELKQRTDNAVSETREALQLIWDSIVKGQQIQLAKKPEIKAVLDRFGVNYNQ